MTKAWESLSANALLSRDNAYLSRVVTKRLNPHEKQRTHIIPTRVVMHYGYLGPVCWPGLRA